MIPIYFSEKSNNENFLINFPQEKDLFLNKDKVILKFLIDKNKGTIKKKINEKESLNIFIDIFSIDALEREINWFFLLKALAYESNIHKNNWEKLKNSEKIVSISQNNFNISQSNKKENVIFVTYKDFVSILFESFLSKIETFNSMRKSKIKLLVLYFILFFIFNILIFLIDDKNINIFFDYITIGKIILFILFSFVGQFIFLLIKNLIKKPKKENIFAKSFEEISFYWFLMIFLTIVIEMEVASIIRQAQENTFKFKEFFTKEINKTNLLFIFSSF